MNKCAIATVALMLAASVVNAAGISAKYGWEGPVTSQNKVVFLVDMGQVLTSTQLAAFDAGDFSLSYDAGAKASGGSVQDLVNTGDDQNFEVTVTGVTVANNNTGEFTLSLPAGAVATGLPASDMTGPTFDVLGSQQVVVSGATLFSAFFGAAASTNDFIDVDGDGNYGFNAGGIPQTDQLAPLSDWDLFWAMQYRGVGSGNGLKNMDRFYTTQPEGNVANPGSPELELPDPGRINTDAWEVGTGVYNANHPGGHPIPVHQVDIAVMDVPTTWFLQVSNGTPEWNDYPNNDDGYGRCPLTAWDTTQGNVLKTISNVSLSDIYDNQIAWVPIAYIANRGTGVETMTLKDLQYHFLTGRLSSGENLNAATRDSGSGTRNGGMNSLGIDPSWGRGDNLMSKNEGNDDAIGTGYLGPKHQMTNWGSSSRMEETTQSNRLALGYTGLLGSSKAAEESGDGKYEIINVDFGGGPVRPGFDLATGTADLTNLVELDADNNGTLDLTAYAVGGPETMATVGDPEATVPPGANPKGLTSSGNPAMLNPQAALYVRNILESIRQFAGSPGLNADTNMPGQYLAAKFILSDAVDMVPDRSQPTGWKPNTNFNSTLQSWILNNTSAEPTVAYGSVNDAGLTPKRASTYDGTNTYTYSDGAVGNGSYTTVGGVAYASGSTLPARCALTGDFNGDGSRNVSDIEAMMTALYDEINDTSLYANTWQWDPQDVIVNIIGDYNGDGNFDGDDIWYFADGLAMHDGKLNRKIGFTKVDEAWKALSGDFFFTNVPTWDGTVAGGQWVWTAASYPATYAAGDARADVAGSGTDGKDGSGAYAGAYPNGHDGEIDADDLAYIQANYGDWNDIDTAVVIDLSCDMNGDLVVDDADYNDVACYGYFSADLNQDCVVEWADFGIFAGQWQKCTVIGQAGCEDPAL